MLSISEQNGQWFLLAERSVVEKERAKAVNKIVWVSVRVNF